MANLAQGQQDSAVYWIQNAEPITAVINDQSDPNYVGAIGGDDGLTGLDSPEIRENAQNLVEAHGGIHGNFWAGRRPVVADVEVYDATIDAREAKLERLQRATLNQMQQDGQLIWFPGDPNVVATTRVNLVPNPSLEYDTVGAAPAIWTRLSDASFASNIFAVTAGAITGGSGANYVRMRETKDATATLRTAAFGLPAANYMPVVPGATYSLKIAANVADAAATVSGSTSVIGGFSWTAVAAGAKLVWYDANGGAITGVSSNAAAPATTGSITFALNGQIAPANAAFASIFILMSSTTASDTVDIWVDAFQFVREATGGAYNDGDSANSSWLGLRGQSASVNRPNGRALTTRVQLPPRITGKGWLKTVQVPLVAADPRIYSTAVYERLVTTGVSQIVENQGRTESPPVSIRINGPGTSPTIGVQSNGVTRSLVFTGLTIASGHYIDIFPLTGRIVDDTGASKTGSLVFASSTWWGIMPGPSNTLFINWVSGNTAASTMRVRWSDAWL